MENTANNELFEDNGKVIISDEVVLVVASLAAADVDGVAGMVGGVAGGFAELLGKKNTSKGVKITKTDNKVSLDLSVIVEYGAKIPDVAWKVQDRVKNEVESMTGIEVSEVNVSVEGVSVTAAAEENMKPQSQPVSETKTESDESAAEEKE